MSVYSIEEILETVSMIQAQHLDIRTVTMGINLRGCISPDIDTMRDNIYNTITTRAKNLVSEAKAVEEKFGIPIVNKRIAVTPIGNLLDTPLAGASEREAIEGAVSVAKTLDDAAKKLNIDFIGGYSALVHKGFTVGDSILINSIPEALTSTDRVCSSINVATTKSGINMDAILLMGQVIKKTAARNPIGCAKLVVFANAPPDNPFMAGAFHGDGEPETVVNVGISGPGVVSAVLSQMDDADLGQAFGNHQAHRVQDHPDGRAGRPGDGRPPRRGVRHRGPVPRAHPGRGRFRGQHPGSHGPGALRHPRHDRCSCAAYRCRQKGRRDGHFVYRRPLRRLHPRQRGCRHGRSRSRSAPSALTSSRQ